MTTISNVNSVVVGKVYNTISNIYTSYNVYEQVDWFVGNTAGLKQGMAIIFKNSFSNIIAGQTYYIHSINYNNYNQASYFTVSETREPTVKKTISTSRPPKIIQSLPINSGASLNTSTVKYGSASLSLDGIDDFLKVSSSSDFGYGTGDFTIEMWINPQTQNGDSSYKVFFDQRNAGLDSSIYLDYINGPGSPGHVRLHYNNGNVIVSPDNSISETQWSHIAVTRQSSVIKLFINGILIDSETDLTNYQPREIIIGKDWQSSTFFEGYIDDLRICKGADSIFYTANFTPPLSQLYDVPSTVLLLNFEGVNGSTNVSDTYDLVTSNLPVSYIAIDLNEVGSNFIVNTDYNKDFEINYGGSLERIATALETIAATSAVIKQQAETTGIHILGPWEWLGAVGILRYIEERGLNLAELKAKVDSITKSW
jgi:hypothetical protein